MEVYMLLNKIIAIKFSLISGLTYLSSVALLKPKFTLIN